MKYIGCLKGAILLLSLGTLAILSSCGDADHRPDSIQEMPPAVITSDSVEEEAKVDTDEEDSDTSVEKQPDLPTPPQVQEPQEDFMAQYIGKTVGDVVQDLGADYTVEGFEGSTMIGYPGNLWFLFGSAVDTITEDLIVRQMIASGQYPAVYRLAGSMTYPEIVEAVGEEADIPQPDQDYSVMDDDWTYSTSFAYRGYRLIYTWLEDPNNTLSASVFVFDLDVDSIPPVDVASNHNLSEGSNCNDDSSEEEAELFCGPGWFEGVMGSRFYVPDGFVQQDFAPAVGHYYLFKNAELDMEISVHEMTFAMIGIDSSAMIDEYASREDSDGVTYATSGDNFYVVSGYYGDENSTIYYDRVDYDDMFRYEVDFQYPASRVEKGEKILLEFLKNYSCS